ncbi:uncharacterized protein M6B38_241695 [Iris pallida]|uniref:Uncharacterized protein n=1 Tax=Iris pallida TaxID=29817 RepID=A0AAX6DJE3_IRIPA|nr:uncharacterized protein M6B38_241695 [Iris pallida]
MDDVYAGGSSYHDVPTPSDNYNNTYDSSFTSYHPYNTPEAEQHSTFDGLITSFFNNKISISTILITNNHIGTSPIITNHFSDIFVFICIYFIFIFYIHSFICTLYVLHTYYKRFLFMKFK